MDSCRKPLPVEISRKYKSPRSNNLNSRQLRYGAIFALSCIAYGIGIAIFTCILYPLSLCASNREERLLAQLHRFCFLLSYKLLPALGLYRIKTLAGTHYLPMQGPAIIVANHTGLLDGVLVLGLIENCTAVMKSRYAEKLPFSLMVKNIGFISLCSTSVTSLDSALKKAAANLDKNRNLLIFPEGTRSTGDRILPFGSMAFHLAKDHGCPIIPILICSRTGFLAKPAKMDLTKRTPFHEPAGSPGAPARPFNEFIIECLPPITPHPSTSADEIAARCRKLMIDRYAILRKKF